MDTPARALLPAVLVSGCATGLPVPPATSAPLMSPPEVSAPDLRSAVVSRYDVPELEGRDAILVVASDELDPLGVRASAFSLALRDGRQVTPVRASVWPAHERGELRSVLLEAEVGGPGSPPPVNLTIVDHVFTADGRDLRGATAPVQAFAEPDRLMDWVVLAEGETDCPQGAAAVRTFWSDLVHLDGPMGDGIRFVGPDADIRIPSAVVDDEPAEAMDNVLDFCTSDLQRMKRLEISVGVVDAAGHPARGAITDLR